MEKNRKTNETCEPCEANFQKNLDKMVNNVEDYSQEKHNRKKEELDAAFDEAKAKHTPGCGCGCGM